jgi:hypothetical protein
LPADGDGGLVVDEAAAVLPADPPDVEEGHDSPVAALGWEG